MEYDRPVNMIPKTAFDNNKMKDFMLSPPPQDTRRLSITETASNSMKDLFHKFCSSSTIHGTYFWTESSTSRLARHGIKSLNLSTNSTLRCFFQLNCYAFLVIMNVFIFVANPLGSSGLVWSLLASHLPPTSLTEASRAGGRTLSSRPSRRCQLSPFSF
jgi:hypothetical protein